MFVGLRKIHYNVMTRIMDMNEADILAGRAKSVSARHYAIYELDRISNAYVHLLCVVLPSAYQVIYIDTKGTFRAEKIQSIAKARGLESKNILCNIYPVTPTDSEQQESYIDGFARRMPKHPSWCRGAGRPNQ